MWLKTCSIPRERGLRQAASTESHQRMPIVWVGRLHSQLEHACAKQNAESGKCKDQRICGESGGPAMAMARTKPSKTCVQCMPPPAVACCVRSRCCCCTRATCTNQEAIQQQPKKIELWKNTAPAPAAPRRDRRKRGSRAATPRPAQRLPSPACGPTHVTASPPTCGALPPPVSEMHV